MNLQADPVLGSDLHALTTGASRLAQHLGNGLAVPARPERHQFNDRAKEYLR